MNEEVPPTEQDGMADSADSHLPNNDTPAEPLGDNELEMEIEEASENESDHLSDEDSSDSISSNAANTVDIQKENIVISNNRSVVKKLVELLNIVAKGECPFRFFVKSVFISSVENSPVEASALKDIFETYLSFCVRSMAHWETMTPFNQLNRGTIIGFAECMRDRVLNAIKKEVTDAYFFSWHINGVVKLDGDCFYYPIAIRFVNEQGKTKEHLFGLFNTYLYKTPTDLSKLLFGLFEKLDMEDKVIAQCYDGALLDVPEINELKDIVQTRLPKAILTHSASFSLNLLAQKAYDNYTFMFFGMLKELSQYFHEHQESQKILTQILGKAMPTCSKADWMPSSELFGMIITEREKIVQTLAKIIEERDSINFQVCLLKHNLEDFSYIFLLYVFNDIFLKMEKVEEKLQENPFDIENCIKEISLCITDLTGMKADEIINHYVKLAKEQSTDDCGGSCNKRENFEDSESKPKHVIVYETLLESIVFHLEVRLASYRNTEFLELINLKNTDVTSKTTAFNCLSNTYGKFFDLDKLKEELAMIYFKEIFHGLSYTSLLELIVENEWHKSLPQTYKFLCLIGSLPSVNIPTLNTLERIKNYVESTKLQEHFDALPLLEVERKILKKLQKISTWTDDIIQSYAERPDCCVKLVYNDSENH